MTQSVDRISIRAPDDWHIHLRDGEALALTVPHVARSFERAIVMPNLVPPVTNAELALAYKQRIMAEVPQGQSFEPLMVLYLRDNTTADEITAAHRAGVVACKLYPAGATTNSDSGVTAIQNIYPALEAMQACGMLLLVHGEVTSADIDIFEREARFIDVTMAPLAEKFPELSIVFEHITTRNAVEFVRDTRPSIGATITAHHLLFNRNHMLAGGIRPHYYCLPILKHSDHQTALIDAATSGEAKFFLGTDSAPHARSKKENVCGCAGSYTAYTALELYAETFDRAGKLENFEAFCSVNGANFYRLPLNEKQVTLVRERWQVPEYFDYAGETLRPVCAGETLNWRLLEDL